MITAGIDVGLYSTKIVLLDNQALIAQVSMPCGKSPARLIVEAAYSQALVKAAASTNDIRYVVGTGAAVANIPLVNEIASQSVCLARGGYKISPSIQTVLNIGAQKTLVVKVKKGKPIKIAENDKCASGSGTFLEIVSKILGIEIENMGKVSERSREPVDVLSTCAVFAESEIISLIYIKKKPEDILKGVFIALARRIFPLLASVGYERDMAMVGGVAKNDGMVNVMKEQMDSEIIVPEFPEMIMALGAAAIGQERL